MVNKIFVLLVGILGLSACSTVQLHSKDGELLDQHGTKLQIVGSPRITCYSRKNRVVADGFFVRVYANGDILVDEFGKRYVHVYFPDCDLNPTGPR